MSTVRQDQGHAEPEANIIIMHWKAIMEEEGIGTYIKLVASAYSRGIQCSREE